MDTKLSGSDALHDIRSMMERSSRFISLSGWSGIAAGSCALIGSWFGQLRIRAYNNYGYGQADPCVDCLKNDLISIAAAVFITALLSAFFFTFLRSKKDGVAIWGTASRRLLWNTFIPFSVGAVFIGKLMELQLFEIVPAASLIFYGLALLNGSRYTLGEVRWLGYAEIITGLACLWFPQKGIYFWGFGFGVLHIIYGYSMWWKYERQETGKS